MAPPPRDRKPDRRARGDRQREEKVVPLRPRRSGLSEARAYHPRGRTVKENATDQASRTGGPTTGARSAGAKSAGAGSANAKSAGAKSAGPKSGGRQQPASGRSGTPGRARTGTRKGQPERAGRSVRSGNRGRGVPPPRRRQSVLLPPPLPPRRRQHWQRGRISRLGNPNARLRICMAVLLALFVAIGGRLVQIQTTEGSQYAALAADSRQRSVVLFAPRGSIFDRDGNVLADDVQAVTIAADPGYIEDRAEVAAAVAPLLGMTTAAVEQKLAQRTQANGSPNRYVVLKQKVSLAVGEAVTRLRKKSIPGLIVQPDEARDVPGGDLAANIIGYTGADGTGLAGIESGFDALLRGVDGQSVYDVGTGGQEIPDGYHRTTPAKAGSDLVLTIDRDLQYQTQQLLEARLKATKSWSGSAIVEDVKTGEILAMASAPTYDASNPATAVNGRTLNLPTASVVEPGSVHKALTISGALDAGVIKPDTIMKLPESITKGTRTFHDTHSHAKPDYRLMGILAQSSNIGTIMIADKLGANRLYAYQRAFGLGSKTEIGLPGESAGIVQPPANWSGPSYGTIPIGLGVAATPLQMTSLYATLANGGVRLQPQLIKSIVAPDGTVRAPEREAPKRVVSKVAAQTVVQDMTAIATDEGTAPLAAIPGYIVAGKTGTGQQAENNKYAPGNVTSFIGIVPEDSPRYVISVFVRTPAGVGGAIAGPTFSDLAGFTLRHYGVSPSGATAPPINLYG